MRMETSDGAVLSGPCSYEDEPQFATNPVRGFPAASTEVVHSVVEAREKFADLTKPSNFSDPNRVIHRVGN